MKPAVMYNRALETHPLTTKCITSGIMYAGGDIIAQSGENHNENKELKEEERLPLDIDHSRLTVFFIFGTFLGAYQEIYFSQPFANTFSKYAPIIRMIRRSSLPLLVQLFE